MALIDKIDHVAKGKGLSIGQAKKINGETGEVSYYYSRPQFKRYDIVARLWYWQHKKKLKELET